MGQAPPSGLKELSRTCKEAEEGAALDMDIDAFRLGWPSSPSCVPGPQLVRNKKAVAVSEGSH